MSFSGLLAVAIACLSLAACGGTRGVNTVRSFETIQKGQIRLQVAADGKSAVLRVMTDPPTVCAVAFGRTRSLGSIADDPAMGGTAIPNHVVFLSPLVPNSTYHFLLTATDAEGHVFQTPTMTTFTTAAHQSNPYGRDVAVGAKVVAVSSQWSSDYKAANAVDGNLSTEWATAGDGNHASITIDLGRRYPIDGVAFVTREMSDGTAITRSFAVVAEDGRRYGPFPAGSRVDLRTTRVSFTSRRLRFEVVTSTGGNTGAAEIEVFSRR